MLSVTYKVYCYLLEHKSLAEQGGVTLPAIASGVGCSVRSASRVIKKLVASGYLDVYCHPPKVNRYAVNDKPLLMSDEL